jgi:hypothetical protein
MGRKTAMTTATSRRTATTRAPASKKTTTPRKPNPRPASAKAPVPRGRQQASTDVAGRSEPRTPVEHAVLAAEQALRRNSVFLRVPVLGELTLPPPEQVAFIGGVAVLAILGVVEWPVAVVLGLGHGLATQAHRKMVRALGEVLEAG